MSLPPQYTGNMQMSTHPTMFLQAGMVQRQQSSKYLNPIQHQSVVAVSSKYLNPYNTRV